MTQIHNEIHVAYVSIFIYIQHIFYTLYLKSLTKNSKVLISSADKDGKGLHECVNQRTQNYWYNSTRSLRRDCVTSISIEYQQSDFSVDMEFFLDLIHLDIAKLEYIYFVHS